MLRRALTLASLLLLAACGGPATATAPSPAVALPDGIYLLAVYANSLACSVVLFGQGVPPGSSVAIPVNVAAAGEGWRVGAHDAITGSLVMTLSRSAVGVEGSASGTLLQPGMSVTLQHQISGMANGPALGVNGTVAGSVNYSGATGTAFCSTNLWSLSR
ncbi:MAG: hypothetical protein ABIX28_04170 [Vicinamibacterales bacterium]